MRDKCLRIFSMGEWKEYASAYEKFQGKERPKLLRRLYKDMITPTPDSQGRIILTRELLAFAEIEKSAVIVGCSTYAEIWSAENWQAELEGESADDIRLELERFGL